MAQFADQLQNIGASYVRHPVLEATSLEGASDFSFSFNSNNPT
jgi:hypothetical protein